MADKVMRSLVMAVARGKYNPNHDFPLTTQGVPRHYTKHSANPKDIENFYTTEMCVS